MTLPSTITRPVGRSRTGAATAQVSTSAPAKPIAMAATASTAGMPRSHQRAIATARVASAPNASPTQSGGSTVSEK